ncbi:mitochondrial matrix Mmp37-domain-containing protein [Cantharellus anzutake]|uniref:mitochondrial matrix Mmp37-domain-containing protein n=1 Tax=Cantharellus anzutake TaxID=1750568 RepID=UPI001903F392|nr:mitochondrial matrix Mmp37-domain-containing protein [Cantharellus anzutake]KAF8340542.1 mitochondrial matrix Mmp37-domain-containing protein [Cantharellus anzutake]
MMLQSARRRSLLFTRSISRPLSTETNPPSPSLSNVPPPLPSNRSRVRFSPAPRPPQPSSYSPRVQISLPYLLPPNFGRNQVLSVPDSTRALLEEITRSFDAPIRYAFAYGSGVFAQKGYSKADASPPLLDFIFAVNHPSHWHSINIHQNPSHYPLHARFLGSSFIAQFQGIEPGIWFNAYVPMNGVMIKYGVTTIDNLCSDLINWNTLYLSGRMHKPIRIIKDDTRVRLTQQVNLVSALRTALLTLPESFEEDLLFEKMAAFSYGGDFRMRFGGENPRKVQNIVSAQRAQFKELYWRLARGLPDVHWSQTSTIINQDMFPRARSALVRKLPSNLLHRLETQYSRKYPVPSPDADSSAFWLSVGGDKTLSSVIEQELREIVRGPATVQSLKGLVTTGLNKSIRYSAAKVGKWWSSRNSSES